MRDYLCNEEELKDTIEFDEKQIIKPQNGYRERQKTQERIVIT